MVAAPSQVMGKEHCCTVMLRSKSNIYANGCTCERTY